MIGAVPQQPADLEQRVVFVTSPVRGFLLESTSYFVEDLGS